MATTQPVPTYGTPYTGGNAPPGQVDVYNPNTGAPLAGAGTTNPNNGQPIMPAGTPTASVTTSTGTQGTIMPNIQPGAGLGSQGLLGVLNNINDSYQTSNGLIDQKNAVMNAMLGNMPTAAEMAKLPPDIQQIIQSGNHGAMMLQAQVLNDASNNKNASLAASIQTLTSGYDTYQSQMTSALNNLLTYSTNSGYQIGDLVKAFAPILGSDVSTQLANNLQALHQTPYINSALTPNIMPSTSSSMSLSQAITAQEGGTYTSVNQLSGALGKYQIMPSHLGDITNPTTGQPLNPNNPSDVQTFLNSPSLQDQLFNKIMSNLQTQYPGDIAKQIAAYYGGDKAAQIVGTTAADASQTGGYPSINQYVANVMSRMNNSNPLTPDFTQSGLQKMGGVGQEIQSWVNDIAKGTVTSVQQVPQGLKNYVAWAMSAQGISSPTADSRFTIASNRLETNFMQLPGYSLVANGLPYLGRIAAAMQNPGSVSDQDLLDSLTKLNSSGNAISDAQVALITDGKSWSDSIAIWGQKLGSGGVLSPSQRQQIQKVANTIYGYYAKEYQPIYDQATQQLQGAGIPKQFWTIPDLNALAQESGLSIPGVTDSTSTGKGSQTDSQFVESSLNALGAKYSAVMASIPNGKMGVIVNSSGQVGTIDPSEYDPSVYTKL